MKKDIPIFKGQPISKPDNFDEYTTKKDRGIKNALEFPRRFL